MGLITRVTKVNSLPVVMRGLIRVYTVTNRIGRAAVDISQENNALSGNILDVVNPVPANTKRSANLGAMLGQRHSTPDIQPMLVRCWPIIYAAGPTLHQYWLQVSCFFGVLITMHFTAR